MRLTGAAIAAILSLGMMVTGEAWAAGAENIATSRQNTQTTSAPTIQVYTRETIVDVMVTDKSGKPVHGLKRSDFTIEQDDKPQEIRGFAEFGVNSRATARVMPKLPQNVYTNYGAIPASGPVNIFLIDALNGDRASVGYAQQQILKYFEEMPAGVQVAVCLLSANGLEVLQGFTSNGSALRQSMNINFQTYLTNIDSRQRDYITIDALDQLAGYVAAIKGRKNLLWFVPGMPVYVTHDGGYGWGFDSKGPRETSNPAIVNRLMDIYERFTAEQIAISPVDTLGPRTQGGYGAMRPEAVAEDTGGKAYYNNNDVAGMIDRAVRDQSQFYTLTYVTPSASAEDGHYKHIKVTVDRPGVQLVYRKGFNAEEVAGSSLKTGSELMTASLAKSAPVSTEVLFDVGVKSLADSATEPAQKGSKTKASASVGYEMQYLVPQSQVSFTDGPNGTHSGSLEFNIVAYSADGKKVTSQRQTKELSLNDAEYQEFLTKPVRFSQTLDLPAQPLLVRVGVLDTVSKKVGTMEIPLDAEPDKQKLSRLPQPGTSCGAGCDTTSGTPGFRR